MKKILTAILLLSAASPMQGSIIETITFDLSALHPGSTLSGTFTLPDGTTAGTTVPVTLSFSDPSNYIPGSLQGSIDIGSGTALAFAVFFTIPTFTNPGGNPLMNNLMAAGAAQCADFPCTATGRFEDNSPPAFAASYMIAPAAATPEPRYALPLSALLLVFVARKRILQGASGRSGRSFVD